MLVQTMRKKDGFIDELPDFLANDPVFMEKHGLMLYDNSIKKPTNIVEFKEKIEVNLIEDSTLEPIAEIQETQTKAKRGRKKLN